MPSTLQTVLQYMTAISLDHLLIWKQNASPVLEEAFVYMLHPAS
ncbi:hypothetical protein C2W58_02329 [Bacillus pumilus]|uniref:Uncharacterized protein n=1 Tax=Bacillus pumilus TaxID=1408 RepID=A0AB34QVM2_BACPU|nr:hypothetical protein BAT_1434 [Bacillus pumilus ATCC 7061]KIL20580.1 hypothetical protein B4127_2863 [Bacillus pumilus]RAP14231.1 hypothetical protein C2W58_02329 [Bacillus pumilus]